MGRLGVVAQQGRRTVLVVDDQVDVAVVVEVAIGESPPDVVGIEVGPRLRASRAETAVPFTLRCSKAGSAYGVS